VHRWVAAFTSDGKLHEFGAKKPICGATPAHFHFFPINYPVWSHILSMGGDALRRNTCCRLCFQLIQLPGNVHLLIQMV